MRKLVPAVVFCCLALTPSSARATTYVGSDIAANTEWLVAGSPYVVTTPVSVYGGVTLTVDPGVTVQFAAGAGTGGVVEVVTIGVVREACSKEVAPHHHR